MGLQSISLLSYTPSRSLRSASSLLFYQLSCKHKTMGERFIQSPQIMEGTYIYILSRRFYPKRLTVHSGYTFVLSVCVFPGNQTHNLCAANAML